MVRVGPGSLIYRQIKSLHCSGYLLVHEYSDVINEYSDLITAPAGATVTSS